MAVATFLLALSFGAVAEPLIGGLTAIAMSALIFAGAAQFGAVTVLAVGGDALTAIIAGAMLNARYVTMSLAITPSLPRNRLRRFITCQTLTDPGWLMSARGQGRFDTEFMLGNAIPQYVVWVAGTALGALLAEAAFEPTAFGLDALFPAFFLAVLLQGGLLNDALGIAIAALAGLIAVALTPIAPPGIPLLAASVAALLVITRRRSPSSRPADLPEPSA